MGLETGEGTKNLADFSPKKRVALVVGNEVRGLTPALRQRLDALVSIPMAGIKESYNVAVACGIALYALRLG